MVVESDLRVLAVLIVLGSDVQIAVRTSESFDEPVLKAVLVECVTATRHYFDLFALREVAEANGAAFVFENQRGLAAPVSLLSD